MAEVACKTADGTVDCQGAVIGDPDAAWRNASGYILEGPEYPTIFDGLTGAAMATTVYIPPRGKVSSWGDSYGNRVDRFLVCVVYLDGNSPSLVMCRGYYTRSVLAAWDWRDGRLTLRRVFDSDDGTPGNLAFSTARENLSVRPNLCADIVGDWREEVIWKTADNQYLRLYITTVPTTYRLTTLMNDL